MRQRRSVFVFFALLVLAGCAGLDVREQLAQAETAYTAVVETAIGLREAGVLDDETARELTPVFVEVDRALQRAHDAVVGGRLEEFEEELDLAWSLIAVLSRRLREFE